MESFAKAIRITVAVIAGFLLLCIMAISMGNSANSSSDGPCDGGFWGSENC
jgi:hypothetical protein